MVSEYNKLLQLNNNNPLNLINHNFQMFKYTYILTTIRVQIYT
jgi:hypothetical protein